MVSHIWLGLETLTRRLSDPSKLRPEPPLSLILLVCLHKDIWYSIIMSRKPLSFFQFSSPLHPSLPSIPSQALPHFSTIQKFTSSY
ncbi:hypothetical protein M758_UG117200 [Ceratodon purpureus]|nr:hypothetical protein M758_UG117200 [Ceratodon purpureus]